MATIEKYLGYAELAQASYVNGLQVGMIGAGYGVGDKNIFVNANEFSQIQAENFANRYEVKAIANPLLTGLDAVLFYDRDNRKYVLSIRGTSSAADVLSEVIGVRAKLLTFFATQLFFHHLYLCFNQWKLFRNHFPHNLFINIKVPVDKFVTHFCHERPWNLKIV